MKSLIPNLLTATNLACGCLAVLAFLNNSHSLGIVLILTAAVADFLDGFVARLLKVSSELGKQLDSLADMVSFGFVPGIIVYKAILEAEELLDFSSVIESRNFWPLVGFLITVLSGFRLAKFNIDTRQSNSFIGLPTPANTLFFLTIPMVQIWGGNAITDAILGSTITLVSITVLFSYLLIAELPLIALKFKGASLKVNLPKYLLVVTSVLLLIIFKHLAVPLILAAYVTLSLLERFSPRHRNVL